MSDVNGNVAMGGSDTWDMDLEGYQPQQLVAADIYRVKIRSCERKDLEWDDKNTGEHKVAPVINMMYTIEASAYVNPFPIFQTIWLPKAGDSAEYRNRAQGNVIALKKAVGHADPMGNGFDKSQVLGAEAYALVGLIVDKNGEEKQVIKKFVESPA